VAAVIRHAIVEGWTLLKSRGLVSPVLAVALAIPISLAGVTLSVRQWLAPVIDLGDREGVVAVLVHPGMDASQRRAWIAERARRHPGWRLEEVPPEELAQRLSSWFPYLEEVLGREGSEILPPMVEITTTDPESVSVLTDESEVLAVGPTSSVNRVVGRAGRRLASVLFAVALALVAGAVLLAAVWVHLELHRHADEIAIMRLMGATEATVRGPFFVAVAVPSVLAAVVSVTATLMVVGWLARLLAPLGLMGVGAPFLVLVGQIVGAVGLPVAAAFVTLERHASNDD
jgi:cell division transport system permease protein